MKSMTSIVSLFAIGMIPLVAETTTEKTTDVTKNSDGSITKTETKTTTTFDPKVQTKVVKYFDTYKTERYGLPPAWVTKFKVKEVPAAWRTTRIAPGVVVSQKERAYLVDAPADLVSELPTATSGVRYYVAGSNVVAVDSSYKVVDSIQIPSVKFTVEDD